MELARGQKDEITCPIQRKHRQSSTIFWSVGDGNGTATSLICVKFSDGEKVMNPEYEGGYEIKEDGSLLLRNSVDVPTGRFWCHVFLDQLGFSSAYSDVSEKGIFRLSH